MTLATNFPHGLFVLLDPETDEPAEFDGCYALQSDGSTACEGLSLGEAQEISRAVNAHDDLVAALRKGVALYEKELLHLLPSKDAQAFLSAARAALAKATQS